MVATSRHAYMRPECPQGHMDAWRDGMAYNKGVHESMRGGTNGKAEILLTAGTGAGELRPELEGLQEAAQDLEGAVTSVRRSEVGRYGHLQRWWQRSLDALGSVYVWKESALQALFTADKRAEERTEQEEESCNEGAKGCITWSWWSDGCKRALACLLALILALLPVLPDKAYADSTASWATVDGPFTAVKGDGVMDGYVVLNVRSEYLAALALIGRKSDMPQLTNDQLAKLSNESTGGKFYELAQTFVALGEDGHDFHSVAWWGDVLYQANMVSICGGYGTVWATETTSADIQSALEDYEVIYNGGDLGGGSGSGGGSDGGTVDGDYIYFSGNVWFGAYTSSNNLQLNSLDGNTHYMNTVWYVDQQYGGTSIDGSHPNNRLYSSTVTVRARKRMFH